MYDILLSIPSYCTMDKMDSTMEFYCPFIYYYPSLPTVPWTRWTVLWNPSIHSGLAYPTVHVDSTMESVISTLSYYPSHPIVPWTVLWNPSIHLGQLYPTVMDRMNSTIESKYPLRSTLSYCPSHPIVPCTGWTV